MELAVVDNLLVALRVAEKNRSSLQLFSAFGIFNVLSVGTLLIMIRLCIELTATYLALIDIYRYKTRKIGS